MAGDVLPVGPLPAASGCVQAEKTDESDALRGDEQRGVGDEVAYVPDLRGIPDCGIEVGAIAHRRLGRQVGQFRKGEGSAGYVLSQGDACGVILSTDVDPLIHGKARMFPAQEGRGKILADEAPGQEKLQEGTAEGFGEFLGVVDRQEEEASVGGEASFQHQSVPMGVGPQEIPEGLKSHDRGSLQKGGTRGQAVELRQEGEDQVGDGAEELLIVAEKDPQGLGDREDELPVRELEEEMLVEVFGEQEGAFLGAGRAEIEPFAGKGTKVFETAFGIRALKAGDAFGVVAAGFEPRHHAGDPLQAEPSVVLGVEGVVGEGEILEVIVEDVSERIRPARDIPGCRGGDRGGRCGHTRKNSRKVIGAWRN